MALKASDVQPQRRRVCVVTGSRAEYGLLRPLIQLLRDDNRLELLLVATGMHLAPQFGATIDEIIADGFQVDGCVDCNLEDDSRPGILRSIARGIEGFSSILPELRPDLVVVLRDRFEIFAAAQSTLILGIPLAHLCGGEVTEGAFDDPIRHSITKMSCLHFVAAEEYRLRVIQLGESPETVHTVGSIVLDTLRQTRLLDREQLEKSIGYHLRERNLLVTYHPQTISGTSVEESFRSLLQALKSFPDLGIIFTKSNADSGGRRINQLIDEFVEHLCGRAVAHTSLGHLRYLSCIQHCTAVVGNSSSGLIEVPALHRPTVNIGERQKGRLRALSVIDCGESSSEISSAIQKALSPEFRPLAAAPQSPYGGDGQASSRIRDFLLSAPLSVRKSFYDLPRKD